MKTLIKILIVAVALFVALFAALSVYIGPQVVAGSTQLVTPEDTSDFPEGFFDTCGFDYDKFCSDYTIERTELISSLDGHIIPADHILAKGASADRKTVILIHGLGGNRYTTYPVAEMFLEQGWNVLAYDQRSTNENTAEMTTFGYWEKFDLIDCIEHIKKIAPEQQIGIWGTSFGGATAALAVGYEDTAEAVDFLILDCPVSSMRWMVNEEMKHMDIGIPTEYMTWCGNIANKLMLGFSYNDADAAKAMENVDIPLLVINSHADTLTPYFMGRDIYDAAQSEHKFIWTVDDSEHTDMWLEHNDEYRKQVAALLEYAD